MLVGWRGQILQPAGPREVWAGRGTSGGVSEDSPWRLTPAPRGAGGREASGGVHGPGAELESRDVPGTWTGMCSSPWKSRRVRGCGTGSAVCRVGRGLASRGSVLTVNTQTARGTPLGRALTGSRTPGQSRGGWWHSKAPESCVHIVLVLQVFSLFVLRLPALVFLPGSYFTADRVSPRVLGPAVPCTGSDAGGQEFLTFTFIKGETSILNSRLSHQDARSGPWVQFEPQSIRTAMLSRGTKRRGHTPRPSVLEESCRMGYRLPGLHVDRLRARRGK